MAGPEAGEEAGGTICDALKRLDPARAGEYEQNLSGLETDLDALDGRLRKTLGPYKGGRFYVFHPAFGYFAEAYGLQQVAVETEGKEPGGRQLAELIDRAKREKVKVIFAQAQFSRKSAEAVAHAIGGKVVAIDHLSRDYMANMEYMANAVAEGLRAEGKEGDRRGAEKKEFHREDTEAQRRTGE